MGKLMHEIDFKIPPWWLKHQPGEKTRHLFELPWVLIEFLQGITAIVRPKGRLFHWLLFGS